MVAIKNKEDFFKTTQPVTEVVKLGKSKEVVVTELGAEDFFDLWTDPQYNVEDGVDLQKILPVLIARSITDSEGNRLFEDADAEKIKKIGREFYLKIVNKVRDLNGMGVSAKN